MSYNANKNSSVTETQKNKYEVLQSTFLRMNCFYAATIAQLAERRVRDRKVADFRFNSRTGNMSLRPWERRLTHVSLKSNSQPLGLLSLMKDSQTDPRKRCFALVWLDRRKVLGAYA